MSDMFIFQPISNQDADHYLRPISSRIGQGKKKDAKLSTLGYMMTEICNAVRQQKYIKYNMQFSVNSSTSIIKNHLKMHRFFLEQHGQQRFGMNGVLTKTIMPPKEQRQEIL